jgi:hypothetical protein
VGCTHAEACPLFPLLRASLRGWRDSYCDSEYTWHDCARYKLSRTGKLVPISLLPNGRDALHLRRAADADADADADQPSTAELRQSLWHPPPSRLDSGAPETTVPMSPFAPAPARPPQPSAPAQVPQSPRTPPAGSPRHARSAPDSRRAPDSTRRWWTRLADWMRGPA